MVCYKWILVIERLHFVGFRVYAILGHEIINIHVKVLLISNVFMNVFAL